jgi:hypothetical protein
MHIQRNATTLYKNADEIYLYFSAYFKELEMKWTRKQTVLTVFRNLKKTFDLFWDYSENIQPYVKYAKDAVKYLDELSKIITCPITDSYFQDEGMKVDDELRSYEKELLALEVIALDKINTALKTVTASDGITDSPIKLNLKSLKDIFDVTITADDPQLR